LSLFLMSIMAVLLLNDDARSNYPRILTIPKSGYF